MESLSESFADMLPTLALTFAACLGWLLFCRALMRRQDLAWLAALPAVPPLSQQDGDTASRLQAANLRLATLSLRTRALGRGRPSDRLFFFGMFAALLAGAAFISLQFAIR